MIEHIAQQADLSKASAGRALEAFIEGVQSALRKGDAVTLVGFGTFLHVQRQSDCDHQWQQCKHCRSNQIAHAPLFARLEDRRHMRHSRQGHKHKQLDCAIDNIGMWPRDHH